MPELIAYAKANPGKVKFGYGINTPPQVLGETLKIVTGADIQSVPYRGGAQAIQDMLGGRIDMNFGSTSTLLPMIKEGKLRAMAFTGVWNFGCTAAIGRKNSPSSAIAKNTRGFASIVEFSEPNVESITVMATNTTPAGPMTRCPTSAATSLDVRIWSIGRTAR